MIAEILWYSACGDLFSGVGGRDALFGVGASNSGFLLDVKPRRRHRRRCAPCTCARRDMAESLAMRPLCLLLHAAAPPEDGAPLARPRRAAHALLRPLISPETRIRPRCAPRASVVRLRGRAPLQDSAARQGNILTQLRTGYIAYLPLCTLPNVNCPHRATPESLSARHTTPPSQPHPPPLHAAPLFQVRPETSGRLPRCSIFDLISIFRHFDFVTTPYSGPFLLLPILLHRRLDSYYCISESYSLKYSLRHDYILCNCPTGPQGEACGKRKKANAKRGDGWVWLDDGWRAVVLRWMDEMVC